jgi:hypothetical protein
MTIPAQSLWIVIGFVRVARIAGVPFRNLPFVRDVTHGAIGRRVSGFEMQARAAWMAGFAIGRRLDLLVFEVTRGAWERGHRSIGGTRVTCRAFRI